MNADTDRFFLDSNILIYSFDHRYPEKRTLAQQLIQRALHVGSGCISFQVVQEFLNVATRKAAITMSAVEVSQYASSVLAPLCQVYPNMALYQNALDIHHRWQYSYYDSLIIAAATEARCQILYSEDMQHNQLIGSLKIVNPFESDNRLHDVIGGYHVVPVREASTTRRA